jgi:hypothetical protein
MKTKRKTKEEITAAYKNMFAAPSGPVFNGHVNDADTRARLFMSVVCPELLEKVEKIEKDGNGIMAIFDKKPNDAIMTYVMLVNAFVLGV